MVAIPDRSGPDMAKLVDTVVNNAPVFPYSYTPTTGFTALNPAATYTPGVAATNAVLTNVPTNEVVLAVCEARNIMITNLRVVRFGSGWGTASTSHVHFSPVPTPFHSLQNYVLKIAPADKDNLTVTLTAPNGVVSTAAMNVVDMFAGNPVWHLGFLTDAQLLNADALVAGYDVKLVSMAVAS